MFWSFNRRKPGDEIQQRVFSRGCEQMNRVEKIYGEDVRACKKSETSSGRFRVRLFGGNFCLCAMTLALGEAAHQRSEQVYHKLLKQAVQGLSLPQPEVRTTSADILREQSRALVQEMKNMGSGQYALAALYARALEESVGPLDFAAASFREPLAAVLSRPVEESLSVWANLYREIAGRPMESYAGGFQPTEQDSRRLGEEDD